MENSSKTCQKPSFNLKKPIFFQKNRLFSKKIQNQAGILKPMENRVR